MKRLLPLLVFVPILLLSCGKDDEKQNNDGYASVGSFEKLEYSAITTGGCEVSKPATDLTEIIMSGTPMSFVTAGAIGAVILENVGSTILSMLANTAIKSVKEYFFGLGEEDKPSKAWACYIFGVCRETLKRGGKVEGFDTVFAGDVPLGAGLSSSTVA